MNTCKKLLDLESNVFSVKLKIYFNLILNLISALEMLKLHFRLITI